MPSSFDILSPEPARSTPTPRAEKPSPASERDEGFVEALAESVPAAPKSEPVAEKENRVTDNAALQPAETKAVPGDSEQAKSQATGEAAAASGDTALAALPTVGSYQLGPVVLNPSAVSVAGQSLTAAPQQTAQISGQALSQSQSQVVQSNLAALAVTAPAPSPEVTAQIGSTQIQQAARPAVQATSVQLPGQLEGSSDIVLQPVLKAARIDLAANTSQTTSLQNAAAAAGLQANPNSRIAAALTASGQMLSGISADGAALTDLASRPVAAQSIITPQFAAGQEALASQPSVTLPASTEAPISQALQQVQTVTQTAQQAQAPQLAQALAQQPAAQQLGLSIVRGVREGADRVDIQLHPAELGRVEVRMELGHDGRIMAVISAEKAETLEHLRRDVQQLEKALADAGFDADRDSFHFRDDQDRRQAGSDEPLSADDAATAEADIPAAIADRLIRMDGLGLDIRV